MNDLECAEACRRTVQALVGILHPRSGSESFHSPFRIWRSRNTTVPPDAEAAPAGSPNLVDCRGPSLRVWRQARLTFHSCPLPCIACLTRLDTCLRRLATYLFAGCLGQHARHSSKLAHHRD